MAFLAPENLILENTILPKELIGAQQQNVDTNDVGVTAMVQSSEVVSATMPTGLTECTIGGILPITCLLYE